ncbi:chaperone protein dnaJ 11, chloroplastic-like [Salvia divinorum]|uniref:Chaperone protein dnaJ 11, chloroplastic-like n=1 Tax=Salvia divinorum TaxID=28513 RepID=A0ABD1GFL7_SALDI
MASTSFPLHSNLFPRRSTAIPPPHSPINPRSSLRVSAGYATAERTRTASPTASCYDVLGIGVGATFKEIKSAYRRLARTLHPDVADKRRGGDAAEEFIRVHSAYATLSDPEKRAVYDGTLSWRPAVASAADYSAAARRGRSWETDQCW